MKGWDHYAAILERLEIHARDAKGLTARCPMGVLRHPNGDRTPSLRLWLGNRGELVCHCLGCRANWRDIARCIGIQIDAFFPPKPTGRPTISKSRVVAEYPYYDRMWALIAVKSRWEPGFIDGQSKSFSWKRPYRDGWLKGLDAGHFSLKEGTSNWWVPGGTSGVWHDKVDVSGLLYNLPAVQQHPGKGLFVVESEKDVHLLQQLKILAVCPPYGCGKWTPQQAEILSGRRVIVVSDDGDSAVEHATKVAGSLMLTAASVRLVVPGGEYQPPKGKGLGNALEAMPAERRLDRLKAIVNSAPEWSRRMAG